MKSKSNKYEDIGFYHNRAKILNKIKDIVGNVSCKG